MTTKTQAQLQFEINQLRNRIAELEEQIQEAEDSEYLYRLKRGDIETELE